LQSSALTIAAKLEQKFFGQHKADRLIAHGALKIRQHMTMI